MSADRWTLLIMKDGDGGMRQFSVTRRRLRIAVGVAAASLVTLAGLALWISVEGSARIEAVALRQKNAVLASELSGLQQRVAAVEGSMARMAERNAQVRNLAGLEPIDAEVLQVGVGGPGGLTLQSSPLWTLDPAVGAQVVGQSEGSSAHRPPHPELRGRQRFPGRPS